MHLEEEGESVVEDLAVAAEVVAAAMAVGEAVEAKEAVGMLACVP